MRHYDFSQCRKSLYNTAVYVINIYIYIHTPFFKNVAIWICTWNIYTKGVCISQACRDESIVSLFFSLPQYIVHSTSTYQAPYNEIIKIQTSQIYIYTVQNDLNETRMIPCYSEFRAYALVGQIFFNSICYYFPHTHIYIYIYLLWEEKTNKLQVHPYRPVSWLPTHQGI